MIIAKLLHFGGLSLSLYKVEIVITAKLLQIGGLSSVEGGNSDNSQIAALWGTLSLSIQGGNSDNSEIAAKWGNFGTHFAHFCPFKLLLIKRWK